jgi:hypothetical protein
MAVFGAGIFADDDAIDVRAEYRSILGDLQSNERATEAAARVYGASFENPGETTAFWLALALTQWRSAPGNGRTKDGGAPNHPPGTSNTRDCESPFVHR